MAYELTACTAAYSLLVKYGLRAHGLDSRLQSLSEVWPMNLTLVDSVGTKSPVECCGVCELASLYELLLL